MALNPGGEWEFDPSTNRQVWVPYAKGTYDTTDSGKYYTVQGGDSWEKVAKDIYGDGRMFATLMAANGGGPLRAGTRIVLPPKVANPFVSNEIAARVGMETSGQYADWYNNPLTSNPQGTKFNITPEFAQAQKDWAYYNRLGVAPDLVNNGRMPEGWGGMAGGSVPAITPSKQITPPTIKSTFGPEGAAKQSGLSNLAARPPQISASTNRGFGGGQGQFIPSVQQVQPQKQFVSLSGKRPTRQTSTTQQPINPPAQRPIINNGLQVSSVGTFPANQRTTGTLLAPSGGAISSPTKLPPTPIRSVVTSAWNQGVLPTDITESEAIALMAQYGYDQAYTEQYLMANGYKRYPAGYGGAGSVWKLAGTPESAGVDNTLPSVEGDGTFTPNQYYGTSPRWWDSGMYGLTNPEYYYQYYNPGSSSYTGRPSQDTNLNDVLNGVMGKNLNLTLSAGG
jgi:hypothetical protein